MPDAVTDVEVGCYVYGVVLADADLPTLTGIDGAEVEYVEHDGIAAAVGEIAIDRPPGRRKDLLAHSEVVDALVKAGPVVPVQFGSVLADRDSVVHDLLEVDHDYFAGLLDDVRGRVQLNLRATYVEEQVLAEVVESDPQIAELRRRTRGLPEGTMHPDLVRLGESVSRAMEVRRADDAEALLDQLEPRVEDVSVRAGGGVDHLLDVALLVRSDRVDEVEELLESLAEAWHERIRMRLVGPVAPYDFAEVEAWA